jgi:hypothetical protein
MTFASGAVLCSIEGAVGADTESCCPNARIWSERALGVFQQYLRIPAEDLSRRQRRRRQARGRLHCGGQRFESPQLHHPVRANRRDFRFGNSNEHANWETAHHVFTYANALDQLIRRIGPDSDSDAMVVRGVLHGVMALYLTRYLNVPPARIAGERGEQLDDLPIDSEAIRAALLDAFDRQRQVDLAGRLVARHFTLGYPAERLTATLGLAVLREDAGFHAYQMLEAGVRQFAVWGDTDEGRHILIAVARYLAAHSPTERAALQTADIARRLMRGGELHQAAGAS